MALWYISGVKERDEKVFQLDRMKSRLNLAQQQSKLYENEISSLRSLYESFDAGMDIPPPPHTHRQTLSLCTLPLP